MTSFLKGLPLAALILLIGQSYNQACATTYKVTPSGKWTSSSGYSSKSTVYSLPDALIKARAGDTVFLSDGTYTDRVESVIDGEKGHPIKIKGSHEAVIKAESPSVKITHSWITIQVKNVEMTSLPRVVVSRLTKNFDGLSGHRAATRFFVQNRCSAA